MLFLRLPASISTAARGADNEDVAGLHLDLCDMQEPLYSPVRSLDPVLAHCARLAAPQAERAVAPAVAQDGSSHCFQETNPPKSTVTAAPTPGTPGARPNLIGLEAHREAKLQNFRIGQSRVGHMCLDH